MWGLHPDRPIQLSDELTLTPLTNLRPSSARNTLLEADSVKPALTQQPRPRAAIVHKFVHRPLYFRDGETAAPFTWDDKHFLSDLCLVLTLLKDSPVVRVAEWYQADTSVPVVGIDSGWAGSFAEPRITQEIAPQSYDEELARKIISGFLRLSPLDRRRLTISLRRLNLAGLREMSSDIALELGIALEALLSEPGDPQDSISYRLKMRAAILLGGPINQREQTARQVSQLYGLRSAAAHGADLDGHWRGLERIEVGKKKYTGQELADTFRNGRQLCGRIARKILQLGEFPSFNRMLLGEQPASDED